MIFEVDVIHMTEEEEEEEEGRGGPAWVWGSDTIIQFFLSLILPYMANVLRDLKGV